MRAAAILDAVADQPEGISLAQLSGAVGLRNSTAFHLVQTLVNLGFLTQLADRRYRIGSRLFTLAAGALDENTMLSIGTPILERLSADTGYASHLAVRSRHEIVVIARIAATGLLQLVGHPGARAPHMQPQSAKCCLPPCRRMTSQSSWTSCPCLLSRQTPSPTGGCSFERSTPSATPASPTTAANWMPMSAASQCRCMTSPDDAWLRWAFPVRHGACHLRRPRRRRANSELPRRSFRHGSGQVDSPRFARGKRPRPVRAM